MNTLTPNPTRTQMRLPERARKYVHASKAPNTITAYKRALRDFEYYCRAVAHAPALPASTETVCEYIAYLADGRAKVSTIDQRIAAIAYAHTAQNLNDPTAHAMIRETMAGIRRAIGTAPNQKAPLLRADVRHLALVCGDDLRGLRDAALILLAFAGAFRESELTALEVRDLKYTADELLITVRKSKTDQEREGRIKRIPILSDASAAFCPVRALQAYLTAAEISSGPVFRKIDRWSKVWDRAMRPAAVAYILKRACNLAGLDASEIAGHSPRAGFVTQAAQDGIALHEIQDVTWHKSSDMVRRYIRNQGISGQKTIRRVLEG